MLTKRLAIVSICLGVIFSISGCIVTDDKDEGYAIDLDWAFGADALTCAEAYVDSIDVTVARGGQTLIDSTEACSAGGVVIADLEDGVYTVTLVAYDQLDVELYNASLEVTVAGADEVLGTINFDPIGHLEFTWAFGHAGIGCATAGVSRVKIKVLDLQGATEFVADPIPQCSELGATITSFELGTWNLVLQGVCDADLEVGFEADVNLDVELAGNNDYGEIVLTDVGGCP